MIRIISAVSLAVVVNLSPAAAQVSVTDAWARASANPRAPAGAAYLTLDSKGAEPDRLIAAESPVSARAELHTHLMENGIARMRHVAAIEVAPGSPTVLAPGGLHIMLLDLKAPLQVGQRFPLTLVFEKAGRQTIDVDVMAAGARGPGGH